MWLLTSVTALLDGLEHDAIRVKRLLPTFFSALFVTPLSMCSTVY